MSYDISLYVKTFLEHALATGAGDWTNADPIPEPAAKSLIDAATAEGFQPKPPDPAFVEFLREQGVSPAAEFELDTQTYLAHLSVHRGELAFTIPYSDRAEASIQLCSRLARAVAARHGLGFWDPQDDQA
jgi:hypothetical protein